MWYNLGSFIHSFIYSSILPHALFGRNWDGYCEGCVDKFCTGLCVYLFVYYEICWGDITGYDFQQLSSSWTSET